MHMASGEGGAGCHYPTWPIDQGMWQHTHDKRNQTHEIFNTRCVHYDGDGT